MNRSKMNDPRFRIIWLKSGAIKRDPINVKLPCQVIGIGINCLNGYRTISCEVPDTKNYQYFVTKSLVELGELNEFPKNSFNFEQGEVLVKEFWRY